MTVKFRDPISAKACIIVRPFLSTLSSPTHVPKALRKCKAVLRRSSGSEAYLYTGLQRFKRSKGEEDEMLGDGADSEGKRLDDFAQWLMKEGES